MLAPLDIVSVRLVLLLAASMSVGTASVEAQRKARDKTVGACTRQADFARRLAKLDPLIEELSQAAAGDRTRLGEEIAKQYGNGRNIECLIRYREPAMRYVFLPLLEANHWPVVARALYGLKMVGRSEGEEASDAAVRVAVQNCLQHADARVREVAANCLSHIGGKGSAPSLQQALEAEKDRFARASLASAIAVLKSETKPYRPYKERLEAPGGARRVAWDWLVKGRRQFNDYDAKTLLCPAAKQFDWPISWYEGSLFIPFPRSSFGGKRGHTGEDMAWFREGCSVFAVADGLVRMVQGAGGNWGFLVVIEHRLTGGETKEQYLCSLYGHLGFDVLVKPGDVVRKGQQIGTVGLSCSVENGGYGAHLHFGLADGPFRKPKGIYKDGSALNFTQDGKRMKAPVIGYQYMPDKPDKNGFPGLGLRARTPEGKVLEVHVGNVPMRSQVSWITGYLKGCRGWFSPYEFLKPRVGVPAVPHQKRGH